MGILKKMEEAKQQQAARDAIRNSSPFRTPAAPAPVKQMAPEPQAPPVAVTPIIAPARPTLIKPGARPILGANGKPISYVQPATAPPVAPVTAPRPQIVRPATAPPEAPAQRPKPAPVTTAPIIQPARPATAPARPPAGTFTIPAAGVIEVLKSYEKLRYTEDGKEYFLVSRNDGVLMDELLRNLDAVDRFGFDFEADTDDPLNEYDPKLIDGISFSWKALHACYLPIGHKLYGANWDVEVLEHFRKYFESKTKLKIAHNASYEAMTLANVGIKMQYPIFDPMIGINVMKIRYPGDIGLKANAFGILGHKMITYDEITGFVDEWTGEYYKSGANKGQRVMKQRQRKFSEVPIDARCLQYTCADSDEALQLEPVITKQLIEDSQYDLVNEIDMPLVLMLRDLMRNGWYTDESQFDELAKVAERKIGDRKTHHGEVGEALFTEIRRQLRWPEGEPLIIPSGKNNTPKPFNLNSDNHMRWLLFDQLKFKPDHKTDGGLPSVDAETIKKLADKNKNVALFKLLLDYSKYEKLESTYVRGYRKFRRETGRLHSTIDQIFVRTGRFSSSQPNLQNCPRADNDPLGIRNIFIAPSKDYSLNGEEDTLYVYCDYSQIELRVFAWYADDPSMKDAFFKGQDIHARTAWEMFELFKDFQLPKYDKEGNVTYIPMKGITVEQVKDLAKWFRSAAKAINFGIIFGMEKEGLANDIYHKTDDEHVRKAAGMLARYKLQYPNVSKYQQQQVAFARQHGYVLTMFNRMRPIPDIHHHNRWRRSHAERQCMNTPVQGSASEIIKLAMVRLHQQMPPELARYLATVMQIHDELVNEVALSRILPAARFIKSTMEQPIPNFDVPIVAECDIGYRWGEKRGFTINEDGSAGSVTFKEWLDEKGYVTKREVDEHEIFVDRLHRAGVDIKIKQVKPESA